jgi:hypothetical protein
MLIGICGAAGSGKDTLADLFVKKRQYRKLSFADPLYAMLGTLTGQPAARLKDRSFKEATVGWIGKSPREMLQTLGTEWGRQMVKDTLWVEWTMRRVDGDCVIPDVRFDNEAKAIRDAGGVVLRITRGGGGCLVGTAAEHASENGISPQFVAAEIDNSGDLDHLWRQAAAAII